MLLHFILMMPRAEIAGRAGEFEYAKRMAAFYKSWTDENFGRRLDVECDVMAADRAGLLGRPGIGTLLQDHRSRGESTWHFYLANFRPLWTDSLSEGYHSENMCMSAWQRPPQGGQDTGFLALKNCTAVSYELAHELLRQAGEPGAIESVNTAWSAHFSGAKEFAAYGADHARTDGPPEFLTIDPGSISTRR